MAKMIEFNADGGVCLVPIKRIVEVRTSKDGTYISYKNCIGNRVTIAKLEDSYTDLKDNLQMSGVNIKSLLK